jgi:hypothetical protein
LKICTVKNIKYWADGVAQTVKVLPCKHKASNPSAAKKNVKKKR